MKKLIALLLTLVMVLGLAACAAKTGGNDTQTYAIITKAAGNPYNEREAAGFEEVMKDAGYNATPRRSPPRRRSHSSTSWSRRRSAASPLRPTTLTRWRPH